MFAFGIVEHLDVIEHIGSRVFSGFECSPPNAFSFQQVEKALDHSIIMTVSATAHAVFQIVVAQKRHQINAG